MHFSFAERKFTFTHRDTDNTLEITNHQGSIYDALDAAKHSLINAEEIYSNYTLTEATMINGIRKKECILDKCKTILSTGV